MTIDKGCQEAYRDAAAALDGRSDAWQDAFAMARGQPREMIDAVMARFETAESGITAVGKNMPTTAGASVESDSAAWVAEMEAPLTDREAKREQRATLRQGMAADASFQQGGNNFGSPSRTPGGMGGPSRSS